jgi:shikimate dehydrogenase
MKTSFGILAHPVAHSLSPQMQSAAFFEKGVDAEFLRFDIPPSHLEEFMQQVRRENIAGLAVSLPHKEAIIPFLDGCTQDAQSIGAVNTVFWKNGKLWGENTDAPGFFRAVEHIFTSSSSIRCAVLGSGGAARAIIFALKKANAHVIICNRTQEKAERLSKEFSVDSMPLSDFHALGFDLVINATSVGLKEDKSPVRAECWEGFSGTAFDIVFDPLQTRFLRDAQSVGAHIITGEKMLLYQGVLQFTLWTGLSAPESVMKQALSAVIHL